ncbi:MAG: hypothetical protein EOP06_23050, partial [Proteobacteria bacterium]
MDSVKNYLGYIDLQTGWILLACPNVLPNWIGVEEIVTRENFSEYADQTPTFFNPFTLLWYVEDSGTCDVFQYGEGFVLFASWLPDNGDERTLEPLVGLPDANARYCGTFHCNADYLVASWAVDSGAETKELY